MDLTGYTADEIRAIATKLTAEYGPFERKGQEVVFTKFPNLKKADIEADILSILSEAAITRVDNRAENAREKILTPGSSQKIAYAFKFIEAMDILKQPADAKLKPEDYKMLASELQLHTSKPLTLREMAGLVMQKVDYTKKAFSFIEVRRYSIRNEIRAAKTREEIHKLEQNAKFDLPKDL